jgi:hypothetical protein
MARYAVCYRTSIFRNRCSFLSKKKRAKHLVNMFNVLREARYRFSGFGKTQYKTYLSCRKAIVSPQAVRSFGREKTEVSKVVNHNIC